MTKEEYEAWRLRARAEAFNTAIMAHATSERPYSANMREHAQQAITEFDRPFPKENPSAR